MNRARGTESVESSHALVDAPANGYRMTAFGQYEDDDSASTLKQRDHKDATDLVISATVTSKWAKGVGGPAGSATETANMVVQPAWWDGGETADSLTATSDNQRMPDKQRFQAVIDTRTTHAIVESVSPSLTASNDPSRSPQSSEVTRQVAAVHASGYGVRRLTPVECERLQAFPDGWTQPAGSDSARYKALGNAVTVNTVRWVLGRMLEQT
jgi:DNA (cytosine-5)-methyltransferase 1